MTRARNLANLGNKNALTADVGLFNIGIGSTQPTNYKLDVVGGNAYIGGGVTITGNLSVGGTITYEDVTNVDAVGIITAAKGFRATAGGVVVTAGVSTFPVVAVSAGTTTKDLLVTGVTTATGDVSIADKIIHTGDTNTAIRFPAADTITAETGASERLRIDSSGRLLLGHTASVDGGSSLQAKLQVSGTDFSSSSGNLQRYQANSTSAALAFSKSRNGTQGSHTILQDGDEFGKLIFYGSDGNDFQNEGARITSNVDGTPGNNAMPGSFRFYTTAQGAIGASERVRITSDGDLGVGDNSPDVRLHVTETVDVAYTVDTVTSEANNLVKLENPSTTANAFSGMQFRVGSGADMFVGAIQQSANAGDLYVVNQNSPNKELVRIKSTGKVGLGTNNPASLLDVSATNTTVWPFTVDVNNAYAYSPYPHELQIQNHARDTTGAFAGLYFHSGASADGSYISAARIAAIDSGNYKSDLAFGTRDTNFKERLRITADGNVGINTTLKSIAGMSKYLSVSARSVTNGGAAIELVGARTGSDSTLGMINFVNETSNVAQITAKYQGSTTSGSLQFFTSGSERLRINSDGQAVFKGETTAAQGSVAIEAQDPAIRLYDTNGTSNVRKWEMRTVGTGYLQFRMINDANDTFTERFHIASDGHVAIGGHGDPGSILDVRENKDGAETQIRLFNTDNGDTTTQTAALYLSPDSRGTALTGLRAIKENTSFATTAGRDVSLTLNTLQNNSQVEAIRIDSAGNVGVNLTGPAGYGKFVVKGTGNIISLNASSGAAGLTFFENGTGRFYIKTLDGSDGLAFVDADGTTERARISSAGHVLISKTSTDTTTAGHELRAGAAAQHIIGKSSTGTVNGIYFHYNSTYVGGLNYSNTATSLATSSDYRIKENVVAVSNAITRTKQLNPVQFNFIADPDATVEGFIAHELGEVVPEACFGEKDAVDDDGNIKPQSAAQDKVIPLLTAALQELITKVETLEAEVAALKSS